MFIANLKISIYNGSRAGSSLKNCFRKNTLYPDIIFFFFFTYGLETECAVQKCCKVSKILVAPLCVKE